MEDEKSWGETSPTSDLADPPYGACRRWPTKRPPRARQHVHSSQTARFFTMPTSKFNSRSTRAGTLPAWRLPLQRLLKDTFGLRRLREGQAEVIDRVMEGHDTVAVMPTGAGKSLCFQLPTMLLAGRTVVVSPLISLMKDKCDKLSAIGIPAVCLHSALDAESARHHEASVMAGSAKLIFLTPERLT
ncbi:MAG: hypothetical protein RLZZ618_3834 [Pseudomonadota bacterium]